MKPWWFLLSLAVGGLLGHGFLHVVFRCRRRYVARRGRVACGAGLVASVGSALALGRGVQIVDMA